ncbi:MAG: hypothetical protein ACSW8H_03110 [bacterium]
MDSFSVIGNWISKYIGDGIFFIVVLAAAVYICIFMRGLIGKFIIPVVVCIVVVANPLTFDLVFKHVIYWRLFWMVPDSLLIAVAGVHLAHRWNSDLLRILIGAGMVAVILLTGRNVYTEAGYEVALNPEKLSQGVVDVAKTILSLDAKPKCIVQDRYLIELRQYSGNIELYYGRDVDGYIIQTSEAKKKRREIIESDYTKPEDYEYLVKGAYSSGYDFLVVHMSNPIPPEIAGKYGYRIVEGLDGSTIYYCPELCHEPATKKAARERKQAIKDAKARKAGLREAAKAAKEAEELAKKGLSKDDGTAQLWGEQGQ